MEQPSQSIHKNKKHSCSSSLQIHKDLRILTSFKFQSSPTNSCRDVTDACRSQAGQCCFSSKQSASITSLNAEGRFVMKCVEIKNQLANVSSRSSVLKRQVLLLKAHFVLLLGGAHHTEDF